MRHLTTEELVELYYGEAAEELAGHAAGCLECASALAGLREDLAGLAPDGAVEDGAGERMWEKLRPRIVGGPRVVRVRWASWVGRIGVGLAAAVILGLAFYAGHAWERGRKTPTVAVDGRKTPAVTQVGPGSPVEAKDEAPEEPAKAGRRGAGTEQRAVIVVVLADQLDRSEQLLVELNHPDDAAEDGGLVRTARQLLAENRLYQRRGQNEDPAVARALKDLEPVLTAVAAERKGMSEAAIAELEKKLNTDNVLFEVRVLRSRVAHGTAGAAKRGDA
jgi:hypothetical protein